MRLNDAFAGVRMDRNVGAKAVRFNAAASGVITVAMLRLGVKVLRVRSAVVGVMRCSSVGANPAIASD